MTPRRSSADSKFYHLETREPVIQSLGGPPLNRGPITGAPLRPAQAQKNGAAGLYRTPRPCRAVFAFRIPLAGDLRVEELVLDDGIPAMTIGAKQLHGVCQPEVLALQVLRPTLDPVHMRVVTGGAADLAGACVKSLGVITGAMWGDRVFGQLWFWDPKETWSSITWLIFLAYLHARYTLDWRGRRAAILAIVGFAALVFTYVGVDYLLPQIHGASEAANMGQP